MKKAKIFFITLGMFAALQLHAQLNTLSLSSSNSSVIWRIKSQADVGNDNSIHTAGFNAAAWVKGVVPGTVFGSHVAQGLEADPNFGDNIYKVDKAKYDRNFWYRTEFSVPSSYNGSTVWLNLEGINRDADVYLNGVLLGSLHGNMQRGKFNISNRVNGSGANVLALLVYLPVVPMNCSAMPSYVSSASWDWMPYVPGLNMGITDDIYLTRTLQVNINNPWIRTDVSSDGTSAVLRIATELENTSASSVSGTLSGVISPGNHTFSIPVTIAANHTSTASTTLSIQNPSLWWPNGYGPQNLYTCNFKFTTGVVTDSRDVTFGIREYTYDTEGGVLHLSVNGKRVFLKGGNWGMSEYMLRCRGEEYDTKVRLHKEMNFNVIRNWVSSVTDEEFYNACDKYGMMVWDDFWLITTYIYFPRDQNIYNQNVIEKIKRYRNHPSIALWCGANEFNPPSDYDALYRAAVSQYDANDRHYQPNSNAGNLSGSGPWVNFSPEGYFDNPPRNWGGPESWGMRSEIGTAVFTNFESFKKFIPQANWWPRNDMWDKHFFGPQAANAGPDSYESSVNSRYGISLGIEEFCKKSQLLNIETNKAMYEGWLHNMWNDASGVLVWMSQSAYPSLVWQTYDYYYDLTGAYWGAKKGSEPIHIQMSPSSGQIEVVNSSGQNYSNLTAEISVYNVNGMNAGVNTSIAVSSVLQNTITKNIYTINFPGNVSSVHFVKLKLKDGAGNLLSDNFYWRGVTNGNFTALNSLQASQLTVSKKISVSGANTIIDATITNLPTAPSVAFATRVQVVKAGTLVQVLPVFMDDNYFTLLPGESRTIHMEFKTESLSGAQPGLVIEPYNGGTIADIGPNLALLRPATTSSQLSSNTGSLAGDGKINTRWESAYSDPQWISADLGNAYNIERVRIYWEGALGKDYQIQTSNNGTAWNTIRSITGNSILMNDVSALAGNGRYIRVLGTSRATIWGYSIYELEVYGKLPGSTDDITDLGGIISAQYNDSPLGEEVGAIIDNTSNTKYLTFHNNGWVQYRAPASYVVTSYSLTSANDSPERDPLQWTLQGSLNGATWVTIDTKLNEDFGNRMQKRNFSIGNSTAYQFYRFNFTNNSGTILQIAEMELFGVNPVNVALSNDASARMAFSDALTIYPNPSKGTLNVEGAPAGCKFQICDLNGKSKLEFTHTEGAASLNIASLPSGIYLLVVISKEKTNTIRFEKQ